MSRPGLHKGRLERLHRILAGYVERGELPGLVALVARNDDLFVDPIGTLAFGQTVPMQRDTIFRAASLSKPVTAAAAMILVEECKLRLDESIEPWIPELANRQVLRSISSSLDDTVAARRAITVRDLLTMRMGFGSVMAAPGTHPIQRALREYKLGGDGPPRPALYPTAKDWIEGLGSLPWMAQPGERWMYHLSSDVLGVLVARVAGKSLGAFMKERLFDPLEMRDTGFFVDDERPFRMPIAYQFNHQAGALEVFDDIAGSAWRGQPPHESGGGGLVTTVGDYLAFARMLLDHGRHGKEQILSRATVELMTSDQLTAEERAGAEPILGRHASWGFGMAVDIGREQIFHNPGRYGWTGGTGTTAYVDPEEGMIGMLFTQRLMDSPEPPRVMVDFWTGAYAAME